MRHDRIYLAAITMLWLSKPVSASRTVATPAARFWQSGAAPVVASLHVKSPVGSSLAAVEASAQPLAISGYIQAGLAAAHLDVREVAKGPVTAGNLAGSHPRRYCEHLSVS